MGRPSPNYGRSVETDVVVVLHGGKVDDEFVKWLIEANRNEQPLNLSQLLVIAHLRKRGETDEDDAAILTQQPRDETTAILDALMRRGLIQYEETDHRWILSSDTLRKMNRTLAS